MTMEWTRLDLDGSALKFAPLSTVTVPVKRPLSKKGAPKADRQLQPQLRKPRANRAITGEEIDFQRVRGHVRTVRFWEALGG